MVVDDIEMKSFDEEFFKRLAIAHRLIESRNDPVFTHWANILLSETLVASYGMVSQILRVSDKILLSRARKFFPYDPWRTTIPLSIIPDLARKIEPSINLFWYGDASEQNLYRLPNSELPQYLYFLTRKLNTPERKGQMSIDEINKLLPNKWREYL